MVGATLRESLRPWRQAGLEFFLLEGAVSTLAQPQQATSAAKKPAPKPPVWPEPWLALAKSLCRPARTVWTYPELGLDLGGQADPDRRRRLTELIRRLAWPKGSITYWPHAVWSGQDMVPDLAIFWQGLERIKPDLLVLFGQDMAKLIGRPPTRTVLTDLPILVLPGLADLDDPDALEQALLTLAGRI